MKITGFNVVGYKRFPLLGVNSLKKDFTSDLVMIQGSNGSGKSSLFELLSALPADKSNYEEGGMEEIFIRKNGNDYAISSCFVNKTPLFSFYKNGEELNTPGLITTQRELAYSEFGITASIHALMTGAETFTDLSFGGRKKLFSTLTRLNIDKVLKAFSKLTETLNLKKLQLKTELQQINFEESKLVDEEEIKNLKEQREEIAKAIDKTLEVRNHLSRMETDLEMNNTYETLSSIKEQYLRFVSNNKDIFSLPSGESFEEEIEKHKRTLAGIETSLPMLYTRYEELVEQQRKYEVNNQGSSDYQSQRNNLLLEIETMKEIIGDSLGPLNEIDFNSLNKTFYRIHQNLPLIAAECEGNYDEATSSFKYNRRGEETARLESDRLYKESQELQTIIRDIEIKERTISEYDQKVHCKKCGEAHTLLELVSLETKCSDSVEFLREKLAKVEEELSLHTEYIKECVEFKNHYTMLVNIRKETEGVLPVFWEKAHAGELITKYPTGFNILIAEYTVLIDTYASLRTKVQEVAELDKLIKVVIETSGFDSEKVKEQIHGLEKEIHYLRIKQQETKGYLERVSQRKEIHAVMAIWKENLTLQVGKVRSANFTYLTQKQISVLDDRIRELRMLSVEMDNTIRESDNITYLINQKKKVVEELEDDIFLLTISQEELSPKNGLIAATISSFLNTIIDNINLTLSRIWSYKMVLVPIDVETDALNYRFKVQVEDKLVTEDIGKVSRGMKEAINLAFKLVLYRLLGFENYPLFLDELASNMDTRHTEMMSILIESFSKERTFSQIFIISHKESMDFLKGIEKISLS